MSSYEEDIKVLELLFKIADLEKQLGLDDENSKPVLLSVEKKKKLKKERENLIDEYHELLIDLDRIRVREWPGEKGLVDIIRKFVDFDMDTLWKDYNQYILDSYENSEILDRGAFCRNYFKLKPPYIRAGTKIPEGIQNIYHESRWCFVYGQYNASIALSRTVIETVLKAKFNLEGTLDFIIDTAKKRNLISEGTFWKIDKVRRSANKILHQAKLKTEKEAKNSIDHVLDFLEEIYLE
jgi:hypothetical protein